MPLYEFQCGACGVEFELLVRSGDPTPTCPGCDGTNVKRRVSLFAVSSDDTRQASLDQARQTAKKIAQDKSVAEQEVAARHSHDDH